MSAYSAAVQETMIAVERRARRYRKLMVAIVSIGVTAVLAALVARSPSAFAPVVFVLPACAIYFIADAMVINEWRLSLLRAWAVRELDFVALVARIRAHPTLPHRTVEGMLMTLPSNGELAAEQRLSSATRRAVAATVLARQNSEADALVLSVVALAASAVAVNVAVWIRSWSPVKALTVLVLVPAVRAWMQRRRRVQCDAAVAAVRDESEFSERDYADLASRVR